MLGACVVAGFFKIGFVAYLSWNARIMFAILIEIGNWTSIKLKEHS